MAKRGEPKPPIPTEKERVARLLAEAACLGVHLIENVVEPGKYHGTATGLGEGSADLVGCDTEAGSRLFLLEAKRGTDTQSNTAKRRKVKQAAFAAKWAAHGAVTGRVVTPEDMRAVILVSRLEPWHRRPVSGPEALFVLENFNAKSNGITLTDALLRAFFEGVHEDWAKAHPPILADLIPTPAPRRARGLGRASSTVTTG